MPNENEEPEAAYEEETFETPPPAAAAPAPAAAAPAPKEKKAKKVVVEDLSAGEPFAFALAADKVVAVTFAVSGAALGGGPLGSVGVSFRVEAKSSKKAVEWLEVAFEGGAAETARVTGLKPKEKGEKPPSKRTGVRVPVADAFAPLPLAVKITYKVEGSDKVVALDGAVLVRAAALLVATSLDAESYRALMAGVGATLSSAVGTAPLLAAGGPATVATVLGVLRAFQVAGSPNHAILYGKTLAGGDFMALAKVDEATGVVQLTVKSTAEHAAAVLKEIVDALALAAKAGKDDE
jgi:hypothetical protein